MYEPPPVCPKVVAAGDLRDRVVPERLPVDEVEPERIAARGDAPDSSVYVHIWRKEADKKWKLAVIVENPIRPK